MHDNLVDLTLLHAIGEQHAEGIIVYDLTERKFIYINSTASIMTGLNQQAAHEDIVHRWNTIPLEGRAYLKSQLHLITQNHRTATAEFCLPNDTDPDRYLYTTGFLVNRDTWLMVFMRDHSAQKEQHDYLIEFGIKKNTLLDTLTHNLSGSMNLTQNLTLQAERVAGDENDNLKKFLKLIAENTNASLKIIEDFLQYEHEKSPRIQLRFSRVNIIEKVRFIYEQLRYSYPERQFEYRHDRQELNVTTDDVKLLQVINNLVSNAIKFSPAQEIVSIRVQSTDEQVILAVEDRGIGIPDTLKPFIFMPQPTTGRPGLKGEPSTGQGLMICKHLVEMIGGKIRFESREHVSTTFFVILPYAHSDQVS